MKQLLVLILISILSVSCGNMSNFNKQKFTDLGHIKTSSSQETDIESADTEPKLLLHTEEPYYDSAKDDLYKSESSIQDHEDVEFIRHSNNENNSINQTDFPEEFKEITSEPSLYLSKKDKESSRFWKSWTVIGILLFILAAAAAFLLVDVSWTLVIISIVIGVIGLFLAVLSLYKLSLKKENKVKEVATDEEHSLIDRKSKIFFWAGVILAFGAVFAAVLLMIYIELLAIAFALPFAYLGIIFLVVSLVKSLKIKRNSLNETKNQRGRRITNWVLTILFSYPCLGINLIIVGIANFIVKRNEKEIKSK
jgi:hypothetical protein